MSDIMNIGASGIRAYQNAISTVSENIANSGVDGYSKRTTNLSEVAASTSTITRRDVTSASGVTTTGITRASDQFKEADVRSTGADLARSDSAIQWLDQIQTALTGNKLSDQLTSFFNAASAVAADPSASAPRTTMLDAAQGAAAAFTATGSALDQVATNLDATAQNSVTTLNGLAAALAKTNDALGRNVPNTDGSAQLLDQRDQLPFLYLRVKINIPFGKDAGYLRAHIHACIRADGACRGNHKGQVAFLHRRCAPEKSFCLIACTVKIKGSTCDKQNEHTDNDYCSFFHE